MKNTPRPQRPYRLPGNSRGPILRYDSIFKMRLSSDEAIMFKQACERDGVTQTEVIRFLMSEYIHGRKRIRRL